MKPAITADQFCEAEDLQLIPFTLPEEFYGPNAVVYLKPWDAKKRSAWEEYWTERNSSPGEQPAQARFDVLRRTVVDENGKPLFGKDDKARVLAKRSATVEALFEACLKLNAVRNSDIEDLAKNSESGPSNDSSSGSAQPETESTPTSSEGD